jgi:hypothetical protein
LTTFRKAVTLSHWTVVFFQVTAKKTIVKWDNVTVTASLHVVNVFVFIFGGEETREHKSRTLTLALATKSNGPLGQRERDSEIGADLNNSQTERDRD